ncbi:MAG: hypothetical protein BWX86_02816 [Verrucomicrobia bacterium ADurb.Bin122]|nr:MAG: hypothetical protein BWX86_02816 [Verrucomicrobia bacterium ADurb.Bin122]
MAVVEFLLCGLEFGGVEVVDVIDVLLAVLIEALELFVVVGGALDQLGGFLLHGATGACGEAEVFTAPAADLLPEVGIAVPVGVGTRVEEREPAAGVALGRGADFLGEGGDVADFQTAVGAGDALELGVLDVEGEDVVVADALFDVEDELAGGQIGLAVPPVGGKRLARHFLFPRELQDVARGEVGDGEGLLHVFLALDLGGDAFVECVVVVVGGLAVGLGHAGVLAPDALLLGVLDGEHAGQLGALAVVDFDAPIVRGAVFITIRVDRDAVEQDLGLGFRIGFARSLREVFRRDGVPLRFCVER